MCAPCAPLSHITVCTKHPLSTKLAPPRAQVRPHALGAVDAAAVFAPIASMCQKGGVMVTCQAVASTIAKKSNPSHLLCEWPEVC